MKRSPKVGPYAIGGYTLVVLMLMVVTVPTSSRATLVNPGDIAFVGSAQLDSAQVLANDSFSFMLLAEADAGQTVFFTDQEGAPFGVNEGALSWTTTVAVPAFSVINIQWDALNDVLNGGTPITGTVAQVDSGFSLNGSGDGLIAYLGTVNSPTTFLAAFNIETTGGENEVNIGATGLTYGLDAINLGGGIGSDEHDVAEYVGTTTFANAAAARAAINDPSNWVTGEGAAGAGLLPFNVAATIASPPPPVDTDMDGIPDDSDPNPTLPNFVLADANGDYNLIDGNLLSLSSLNSEADQGIASFMWDINNDGAFDVTGASPSLNQAALLGLGLTAGDTSTITLKVTDTLGNEDRDTAQLTIQSGGPSPNPSGIPEPTTAVLGLMGIAGLVTRRRKAA